MLGSFAGEPACVAVRGRDAFLNPIQSAGAKLVAQLRRFCGSELAEPDLAPAEIRDRGDGIYEIDCALKTACDFEVRRHFLSTSGTVMPLKFSDKDIPGHLRVVDDLMFFKI
jgi:hypothetical protein